MFLIVTMSFPRDASGAMKEIRAVWVTRWAYANHALSAEAQQERVREIFRRARDAHINTVFFQVRGQADAFYRSSYEPWAAPLSGRLGEYPGWDPLALAIEEGRRNGIEVHAWVNVFTCWSGSVPPPEDVVPTPLYWAHPEWICVDQQGERMSISEDDYVWVSPGISEVREHVLKVVTEIVEQYAVDGLHLDYVRYPGIEYSHDPISTRRFLQNKKPSKRMSWAAWQRDQVTLFVRNVYDRVQRVRPEAKVSAAVVAIYRAPNGKWDGYHRVYQDAREWLASGWVDFVVPMTYWRRIDVFPFGRLLYDWVTHAYGRHVCAGIAVPPNAPAEVAVRRLSPDKVMVSWKAPPPASDGDLAVYYNIYRASRNPNAAKTERGKTEDRGETEPYPTPPPFGEGIGGGSGSPPLPSFRDTEHLVHITTDGVTSWVDHVSLKEGYFYAVSALDDGDVESELSDAVWIGPETGSRKLGKEGNTESPSPSSPNGGRAR